MKEVGIRSAGTTGTIRIKERQYKPARKRRGVIGKPEFTFLDEIGKFVM
jgi:hypothetical protein